MPDSYKANVGNTYKVYGILEHVGLFTFLSKFTAFSRVFAILFYFPCQTDSSRRFKQSCAPLLMKHNIGKIAAPCVGSQDLEYEIISLASEICSSRVFTNSENYYFFTNL